MEKQYKIFEDLEFKPWGVNRYNNPKLLNNPLFRKYIDHKQAVLDFPNGYSVSVLLGSSFYSDGISTYEVGIFGPDGDLYCIQELTGEYDSVIGYQTKEQVTAIMKQVQEL